MPLLTPRELYYVAVLVCRDPRIQWEVVSIVEKEVTKAQGNSDCIQHEMTNYHRKVDGVWIQERLQLSEDHIRLIVKANNIQDALHKVWSYGLEEARNRKRAKEAEEAEQRRQ